MDLNAVSNGRPVRPKLRRIGSWHGRKSADRSSLPIFKPDIFRMQSENMWCQRRPVLSGTTPPHQDMKGEA
jgi:hypothetical protein